LAYLSNPVIDQVTSLEGLETLHPRFVRENELALPVIGVTREVAEGKRPPDFNKALELATKFKAEY